jgi:hypothetical protein
MFDALTQLDWLAVALASLAYYLLGALWFTPLFGKTWDRSIGYDRAPGSRFGVAYYIVPLVSALLVSLAIAILLAALAPVGLGESLLVGVVVGLGVAAAVSMNNGLTPHTPHPFLFGAVTGSYHLVGIVIVAAIIGAFGAT